jgi:hypothetical protein
VPKRVFTPAEANSALAEVRPVAERIVALRARMTARVSDQSRLITSIGGNGSGHAASDLRDAQAELEQLAASVGDCLAELDAIGVAVKDLDTGLLDFPALRDGEEIELCWRVGEADVAHWHRVGEGFPGRKPIDWGE